MKALNRCERKGAVTARYWSTMLTFCALTTMSAHADERRHDAPATVHGGSQCAGQQTSSSLDGLTSQIPNPCAAAGITTVLSDLIGVHQLQVEYKNIQAIADEAVSQSTKTERQDSQVQEFKDTLTPSDGDKADKTSDEKTNEARSEVQNEDSSMPSRGTLTETTTSALGLPGATQATTAVIENTGTKIKNRVDSETQSIQDTLRQEEQKLRKEVSELKNQLRQTQAQAAAQAQTAMKALKWLVELSPNVDGSMAFQLGGEYAYLKSLLIGLKYFQLQRTKRDACDRFATSACKAYTDINDHVLTLKALGYELDLGKRFSVSFNVNGIYLHQTTEGTSVDTGLNRYVENQGAFTSLQVNGQLEADWRITQDTFFHLEGSFSPYHRSVERESGFDSGLLSRTSMSSERIGNDNNLLYTGELGTYTNYFDNDNSNYLDAAASLYFRDLIGRSDVEFAVNGRYLSYGATANCTVVYNGEVSEVETSKDFEKLDLIAKVAFELSFLGFIPSNPMFGLTLTRSEFDGFNQKVTNDSFGFAFSFATPPE